MRAIVIESSVSRKNNSTSHKWMLQGGGRGGSNGMENAVLNLRNNGF